MSIPPYTAAGIRTLTHFDFCNIILTLDGSADLGPVFENDNSILQHRIRGKFQ
jgi:hypothetical protein